MKKSKVMNLILTIILIMSIIFMATQVLAADGGDDLLNDVIDYTPTNTNSNSNNTSISNTNNNVNNSSISNTNNNINNTNSSLYNNTNLPKTGLGDTLPIIVLVVVGGISAVYAYKKINDYKNV